jgi:hypothetical protein
VRSPWPANSCKRRQPWIGEKGHLERDIAVIGGHKIIPGKDFHFSPVYASALPSPARPRQKVLTVSSRPEYQIERPFINGGEGPFRVPGTRLAKKVR